MPILLGCIADDFTGATDLANTLVKNGMRATQLIGVPKKNADVGDAEAVVVALKSRTAPVGEAVSASLAALAAGTGRAADLFQILLDVRLYTCR
jgi:uncharacterized protein YgbK (DUF1537 family)